MRKIKRLRVWRLTKFGYAFKDEDYKHSAKWEKYVAEKIIELSDYDLEVICEGFGAGISEKIKDERTQKEMAEAPLDLLIKLGEKEIARVEVAADKSYTYAKSRRFPTRSDKIKRANKQDLPAYIVYLLTKEPPVMEFWLPVETFAGYEPRDVDTYVNGRYLIQNNYMIPKQIWNKGLESLVKQFN